MRTPTIALTLLALAAGVATATAATSVPVSGELLSGAAVGDRLWVLTDRGTTRVVVEVDPARGRPTGRRVVVGTVPADEPGTPPALVRAGGALWTVDRAQRTAVRIDPRTARRTVGVPVGGAAIGAGYAGLWAADGVEWGADPDGRGFTRHRLVRLDPSTGRRLGGLTLQRGIGAAPFTGIAVGRDAFGLTRDGTVGAESSIDGSGTRAFGRFAAHAGLLYRATRCDLVTRVRPGGPGRRTPFFGAAGRFTICRPEAMTVGPSGSVWVSYDRLGKPQTLVWRRIDGRGTVHRARIGRDPVALIPVAGGVWVVDAAAGRLTLVRGRP